MQGSDQRMRASLVPLLVLVLLAAGCGRKSALEVPGGATGALPPPSARMADTDLDDGVTAPPLGSRVAREARVRSSDIRGANADAPGPGETVRSDAIAIGEGPARAVPGTEVSPDTASDRLTSQRFVLDPLL